MASHERHLMTLPDRDTDSYNAERASIALERAELAKMRATLNGGVPKVVDIEDFSFNNPGHIVAPQDVDENVPTEEADKPAPWTHDTRPMDDGYTLEYRKPDSSALIAISMIGDDAFNGGQQMRILNKFMSRHMSTSSLGYVLDRMADPDDAFDLGALISTLTEDVDAED